MKLVDMKFTPEELKARDKAMTVGPGGESDEQYPWSTKLNFGKTELDKLGLTTLPEVGAEFHIEGYARVVGVRQEQGENDEDSRSVELQITQLGCEPKVEAKSAAQAMYGK